MLNPSLYAVGGFELPKFIPQQRVNLEFHHLGSYAEVVQGSHLRRESKQLSVTVKGKKPQQGEEKSRVNPRSSDAVGGDFQVEKLGSTMAVGGTWRGKNLAEVAVAGELSLVDTRMSLPRLGLNSKKAGKEKECEAGRDGSQGEVLSWR